MSLYAAVYNLYANDPTLIPLLAANVATGVGQGIYYGRQPPHAIMSYIVYWTPGVGDAQYQAPVGIGVDYAEVLQLQTDVYASDPDVCGLIGNQVVVLTDFMTPVIDSNTTVVYCRRISPIDPFDLEPEPDEFGLDVWHAFYLYEVMIERTP